VGKGGGAATASRRSRREEWGEERFSSLFFAPFLSPASPARGYGSAAFARDTLPKQQVSLLAGYHCS